MRVELSSPKNYNNRELSWLAFNERVLEEALDERNPLLERLKFLSIFSSNLDEFFMVRVAGLKDQVKAGFNRPENKAGMTPKQQLQKIGAKAHRLVEMQNSLFQDAIIPELKEEKVELLNMEQLSSAQLLRLETYFEEEIFPVLTPMAVDAYRPFPMLLNKSLNLAVSLLDEHELDESAQQKTAIVQVPAVLDRFIQLEDTKEDELHFVLLEDIISHYSYKLFRGYQIKSVTVFRITRNADMTIHEEGARDLLKEIEKELKKRKWGAAIRLEIPKQEYDYKMVTFLTETLDIHRKDVYEIDGPIDMTRMMQFYKLVAAKREHLVYETLIPQPPAEIGTDENLFDATNDRDIFLHHPYESFEPIVDFVSKAADDPDVLAIKQTLYRVSGDSPIIDALKRAAEKGKQVTVLFELKARFDEENNVQWAKELEKSGCHVIYGMTHLKTHSKITLVVRKKHTRIERFVHLGTGNYNDQTAKLYTDMGLFTSKRKFGIDATNFFNYLSGYTEKPTFHHLSVAPFDIRSDIISMIDEEIRLHKRHGNGRIIMKMNSITDKPIIQKLYEASIAGIQIDLIIRGICCLRPGIKGVSENIRVRSIVGRYLEHTRIYYFHHNGEEKIQLSSADMMTRNMEKRVEILFPIFDGPIKRRIRGILDVMLRDNSKAREQDENGVYHYVTRGDQEELVDSQLILFNEAYQVMDDEE
ncbi:RNA degradosome polyphosphate kinase [Terribacillus saccharophilus]|uniref:Polyphosphate kinase n=1 Tax=Terribacillus saccharophilus TaxID=361277 RepID=A0ABX4GZH3_9BACI|nr:RNA degradosome polyphosphate kinase [Terribacillus saccharophilus]PAD96707.1 RNA degradosome polyphosphate kinase [Terribacillus saccharophilus]PAE00283.1 RNA degradosome polyphosphate kinase [Terribacillus saccharophilus]